MKSTLLITVGHSPVSYTQYTNNSYIYMYIGNSFTYTIHIHADNKRLDEWVSEDRLDIERLQLPRKDSKVNSLSKSSRPASPDVATPTSTEPKKTNSLIGRKRKHDGSVEVSQGLSLL